MTREGTAQSTWPNGVPIVSDEQRAQNLNDPLKLRDLIATLWIYTGRYEETQLTTEQKELFADVVESQDRDDAEYHFDRWWRS